MYVTVRCPGCGNLFQVAREALGKPVRCPFDGSVVRAEPAPVGLPVGEVVGEPPPPAPQEPLSLDDAEPLPPLPPAEAPPPAPAPPRPRPQPLGRQLALSLLLTLLAMAVVFVAFQFWAGQVPESAWEEFVPPGETCRVLMPAEPAEEPLDVGDRPFATGGRRFAASRSFWFHRVWAAFGWYDLAKDVRPRMTPEEIFARERNERAEELGGKVVKEGVVRVGAHEGREYRLETGEGIAVERAVLVPEGPKPRLYVLLIRGPRLRAESPAVERFLNSFRPPGPR